MRQPFPSFRKRFKRDSSKDRGGPNQQEQRDRNAPTATLVASTYIPSADARPQTPSPDSTFARPGHAVTTSPLSISLLAVSTSPSQLLREGPQLGLHIIYDSGSTSGHVAEVDFVAVHGLNFKRSRHHTWETWTKDGKLWLRDFLPTALGGRPVRVMLFGYNSSPTLQSAAIKLDDHARSLLQWLSLKRKDAPQRPLVFIAHSMGGLVVKQALVEATLDPSYKPIVEASRLLVFFATPHQGGNYASVGDVVARIVKAGQSRPGNDLLDALKKHSDDATRRFEQSRHLFDSSLAVSFFEGMQYGAMGIIVERKSATLNLPGSREKQVVVNADHSLICKFDSPDDPQCQLVLGTIAEQLECALKLDQLSEKDQQCLRQLRLTDPHIDKLRIERTKGGLLQDSYRWVLNNPDFQQWHDHPESRLLWVKGDPGKGKTMLLCGIIDELNKSTNHVLSFFFCQAADSRINNATAVLRSLIYMLVNQQTSLLPHVRGEYDRAGEILFKDANTWDTLLKIFTSILRDPDLKMAYLVIDALDECVTDRAQLLEFIIEKSSISPHVKWIVSSRNWPQIEGLLERVTQKSILSLELNAESVGAAVNAYIRHKVDRLAGFRKYDASTKEAVQDYLSSHASSTFLWVALVCQALEDPDVLDWDTLEMLRTFPTGLDALYARMVHQIQESRNQLICKHILATVALVRRPISIQELTALVKLPDSISTHQDRLEIIIKVCGSFLTLRTQIIYFVHQSAQDFLLGKATHQASRDAFNWVFPLGTEDVNNIIFSKSLTTLSTVLRRDIYDLKAPGFPIDKVQTPSPDPLATVRYSCVFWVDHLRDSISNKHSAQRNIQDSVQTFLEQKYLYWLEALGLLRAMPDGVIAITQLRGLLDHTDQRQLKTLVHDAHRFALSYRWIIEQAPLQAYISALVFAPACTLVKKFKAEEPDWISTKPVVEADWNACLQTLEGHSDSVYSVAFSADGRQLASGSYDNTVKIWDPASGQCLQTLEGHSDSVYSVAFSADGRQLASGSYDNTVKIWDPTSGQCLQTLKGHSNSVNSVVFSADSRQLASGSGDKTVKIWDPASGQCLQTLEGHSNWVNSVVFSADGRQLASGSDDNTVKIWDPASGQCLQTLEGHSNWVNSVVFSADGRQLASGSYDNTVKIWDPTSGQCLQTLKGHSNSVNSVVFSADSRQLASGSGDKTVKIWDPASGQCLQTLEGHSDWVNSVVFSADGRQLASGSGDKTVKIWDPASGQCLQTLEGHSDWVNSVVFSADGRQLASGSYDKTVKIWDPASGQCLQTLEGHSHWVNSVAFSADSRQLASGSGDKTVKIWDPASGQCLQTLEGHSNWVNSVVFSADGRQLASGSDDNTVKIWDPTSGQCLQTLKGHSNSVNSVVFSADSRQLASGSGDKTVKIWDPASGQCLQTLEGHSDWVNSVVFSADGRQLASGSYDKTVKIWDPASGQCLQTLEGYSIWVTSVAFAFSADPANGPERHGYRLGKDKTWILCNGRNVLWLPPEYRPSRFAVQGRMVAISCISGRTFTVGFSRDI
ncbi:WD40-repeat-containing domain protein [Apiosordaria backusii]|uniref:WD40-repeat-containing domain protein n=1 Tax=Apiosordaria backusii TaxID=314023 RepID=A0AA40EXF0_9PEZI|nr:WD40-repeat-containing domain protein [Apiosordaria backusii]